MPGNFQVSSKLYDGRIFVIAGETYAEFKNNLSSAVGDIDAESLLTTMAASLVGTPVSAPTQTAGVTMEQANANISAAFPGSTIVNPTPPGVASVSSGRECKHGPMTKREGQSPKGPWKAYMCPTPKGTPDQCPADFIKRGTPEWNNF
jgi:hypothetical protein